MTLNRRSDFKKSLGLSGCRVHASAPSPRCPALGETEGQAASLTPGMQLAWAAPCPNQFEPAVGMEPWQVPTSSLWRPSPAQSCLLQPPDPESCLGAGSRLHLSLGWGCLCSPDPQGPRAPCSPQLGPFAPNPTLLPAFSCKTVVCLCLFKVSSPSSGLRQTRF